MPSQSPTMQSKTVALAVQDRTLAPMPASMPSRSRPTAAPCHATSAPCSRYRAKSFDFGSPIDFRLPCGHSVPRFSPKTVAFAIASDAVQDRLQSQDQDCSPKTVALAPSSLHAMSRLQRYADAFAIAHHAVQDRSLGPDACIHAFALTRCLRHRLRCSPRPTAVPRPRLRSQDRSLGLAWYAAGFGGRHRDGEAMPAFWLNRPGVPVRGKP
jgi:hypothetical protein